jgi:hypothetical protein
MMELKYYGEVPGANATGVCFGGSGDYGYYDNLKTLTYLLKTHPYMDEKAFYCPVKHLPYLITLWMVGWNGK